LFGYKVTALVSGDILPFFFLKFNILIFLIKNKFKFSLNYYKFGGLLI